tara:strand:- start:1157 stop:1270 length:114 start_codon:yes stop_codon:yes gene_type:complete
LFELFSSLFGLRSLQVAHLKTFFEEISEHGIFHGITD